MKSFPAIIKKHAHHKGFATILVFPECHTRPAI